MKEVVVCGPKSSSHCPEANVVVPESDRLSRMLQSLYDKSPQLVLLLCQQSLQPAKQCHQPGLLQLLLQQLHLN